MNRLTPGYKYSGSGRNRLATNESREDGGILSSIGGYLKGSYEKAVAPGGSLAGLRPGATPEEVGGLALGFGPAPLKDLSRQAIQATGLKQAAEKQYSQALGATKQGFKKLTQKVAPGLLERKTFAFTRPGLESKFHEGLAKAGEQLEDVLNTIPKEEKLSTQPILKALNTFKQAFYVSENGKRVVVDQVGYKNTEKMELLVKEFGEDVSFGTIRKVRQILDTAVTKGGKAFGRTVSEGSLVDAQREASNAIRNELAKKYPNLAKVNAEYNFWKNAHDIIKETIDRTTGQGTPLGETIATGAGAVAGFASG